MALSPLEPHPVYSSYDISLDFLYTDIMVVAHNPFLLVVSNGT